MIQPWGFLYQCRNNRELLVLQNSRIFKLEEVLRVTSTFPKMFLQSPLCPASPWRPPGPRNSLFSVAASFYLRLQSCVSFPDEVCCLHISSVCPGPCDETVTESDPCLWWSPRHLVAAVRFCSSRIFTCFLDGMLSCRLTLFWICSGLFLFFLNVLRYSFHTINCAYLKWFKAICWGLINYTLRKLPQ